MLLTFDTCLDKTYVALAENGKIIDKKEISNNGNTYHSAYLISTIKDILNDNQIKPTDITLLATDIGPGSFTGIRACMTVAKIMAQQLNIKVIGISSLEIISRLNKTQKRNIVLLDARKNMTYVWDEEILGAINIEDVKEMVKSDKYSIICDENMYKIFSEINADTKIYTENPHNLAEIMINIINENPKKYEDYSKKLKPIYIQPPPIFGK